MRFEVALAQPRFPHHLLGIMRPDLGKGIADEQLTEDACRAVRMEEVQEMNRQNLVDRGEEKVLLARNEGVLRSLVPRLIGRRAVIDRRQDFLLRTWHIVKGDNVQVQWCRLLV